MTDFVLKDRWHPNVADKDPNSASHVSVIAKRCGRRHDVAVNGVNLPSLKAKV